MKKISFYQNMLLKSFVREVKRRSFHEGDAMWSMASAVSGYLNLLKRFKRFEWYEGVETTRHLDKESYLKDAAVAMGHLVILGVKLQESDKTIASEMADYFPTRSKGESGRMFVKGDLMTGLIEVTEGLLSEDKQSSYWRSYLGRKRMMHGLMYIVEQTGGGLTELLECMNKSVKDSQLDGVWGGEVRYPQSTQ